MKKILLILLLLSCSVSASYAASEDMSVYVRQDVFDAKMETLFNRIHSEIEGVRGDIKALSERIDGLDKRIDGLDKRIDDTHNFLYYLLVLLGAMLLMPAINRWWESREEKKRVEVPLTVDMVNELIAKALSNRTPQVS